MDKIYVLIGTDIDAYGNDYKRIKYVTTNELLANTLVKLGYIKSEYDNFTDTSIVTQCTKYYKIEIRLKNKQIKFDRYPSWGFKLLKDIDREGRFGFEPKTIFDLHQTSYTIEVIADDIHDAQKIAEAHFLDDIEKLGITL